MQIIDTMMKRMSSFGIVAASAIEALSADFSREYCPPLGFLANKFSLHFTEQSTGSSAFKLYA